MSITLTTQTAGALNALNTLGQAIASADGYAAAVVNNKSYAAAVEKGYTRTQFWKDMSKAQRFAILQAMKKRGRGAGYKREGTKVERFADPKGFKIHVPGEGMVEKSIPEVRQFFPKLATSLIISGAPDPIKRSVDETAFYALGPITDKTPVDNGGSGLAGAWRVVTGVNA